MISVGSETNEQQTRKKEKLHIYGHNSEPEYEHKK
jgi:hypothetical protein